MHFPFFFNTGIDSFPWGLEGWSLSGHSLTDRNNLTQRKKLTAARQCHCLPQQSNIIDIAWDSSPLFNMVLKSISQPSVYYITSTPVQKKKRNNLLSCWVAYGCFVLPSTHVSIYWRKPMRVYSIVKAPLSSGTEICSSPLPQGSSSWDFRLG